MDAVFLLTIAAVFIMLEIFTGFGRNLERKEPARDER
jgi:hypothetical protein